MAKLVTKDQEQLDLLTPEVQRPLQRDFRRSKTAAVPKTPKSQVNQFLKDFEKRFAKLLATHKQTMMKAIKTQNFEL